MRTHPSGSQRFALPIGPFSSARGAIAAIYTAVAYYSRCFVGDHSAAEFEGKPTTFPAAPSRRERRGRSIIGALALCLFVSAYLVFGYRSLDSYVMAKPVSSAEAYRQEGGSILSSDELSSHLWVALLRLCDPRLSEGMLIDGEELPLAADFTAPYAYMLSRPDDRTSGWWGLVSGPERVTRHGVLLYGACDITQIPVLMIHGLGASPQAWRELTNDILGSLDLRLHYEILHYTYPTNGLTLALTRQMHRDLSEFFDVVDPEHVRPPMIVIGHSM